MGSVSRYVSDKTIVSSLRKFYDKNEQYSINFRYWLHTARPVKDGIMLNVGSRYFLVDEITGSVIREVK
jgi:hypothetical protein